MEKIRPMLFTTLKKYSGAQLMSDVVAGIIVAIIALHYPSRWHWHPAWVRSRESTRPSRQAS